MSVYCESGQAYPELDNRGPGKSCGLVLYEIGRTSKKNLPILVCRRCDNLPVRK